MKKVFLLAVSVALLAACKNEPVDTTIKIDATDYGAETINLAWATPDGEYKVEPITIENGKGEITIDVPEGTNLRMASLDPRSNIEMERGMIPGPGFSFYAEKGTTTITFDAATWPEVTIKGGKLAKDMNNYWKEMGPLQRKSFDFTREMVAQREAGGQPERNPEAAKVQDDMTAVQDNFIANNPDSPLSLDLLGQQFMQLELADFEARFNKLGEGVKGSEKGVATADRIAKAKAMEPGNPAPAFTKKDKDGNTVTLADYKGKYVMIDFWGTWCGPCRASHPHLIQLHDKYQPLGVEFINIAQEGGNDAREKWLKAIEEDGLTWTQILNDEGQEECDVVSLYAINAFPTKVLIDPQGLIVEKWIGDSPAVDAKLEEIFGK